MGKHLQPGLVRTKEPALPLQPFSSLEHHQPLPSLAFQALRCENQNEKEFWLGVYLLQAQQQTNKKFFSTHLVNSQAGTKISILKIHLYHTRGYQTAATTVPKEIGFPQKHCLKEKAEA